MGLEFDDTDPVQAVQLGVACARNEQLKLDVQVRASGALTSVEGLPKKSALISRRLSDYVREHAPRAVFIPPFYGTLREEELRARVVLDRLIGSGDQSHAVRNLIAGLTVDQYTQLNAFLEATVGARLTHRTTGNAAQDQYPMVVSFRDTNGDLEISAAGAGLVNLVALFASLSRWEVESKRRRVLFLLDEPEAHLHPRLQSESAERLARLVTQTFGAQLVIATHSVDILNRLSRTGARLLRVERAAAPAAVALESDSALFDELAGWVDLTPYTAINFLASRQVLFCEGKGELALLPRLAAVRFRNDPLRLQAFRRWALVELTGGGNAKVSDLLARLVRSDAVRASAKDGTFRVVVVLDRDHEREPGVHATPAAATGVAETKVVWSRHSVESLLVEASVLATWVRALVGDETPADLSGTIDEALRAADADESLCDEAVQQLTAKLLGSPLFNDKGDPVTGEQKAVHAVRRAQAMVKAEPGVWQRGKDRATFVLRHIRPKIPLPARNQFPTDIIRLVEKADVNRIGDPPSAVPAELGALLEMLVAPPRAAPARNAFAPRRSLPTSLLTYLSV